MLKRFISYFVCACISVSLAACNGQNLKKLAEGPPEASKPLLDADATDEELLEVLGDEVHVVADEDYIKMVKEFQEHTEEYAGKIYQLEGIYTTEDGNPCIAKADADGAQETSGAMPLKYLTEELEEGARIRVTGIVNEGEIEGKTVPLLEAIVVETPEEGAAPEPSEG